MIQRRYTPPTCTLEINAEESPLSRWASQPVLNELRFQLSFDDPRQPEDRQIKLWGDRAKLEALHEAVRSYVQDFLKRTPDYLTVDQGSAPTVLQLTSLDDANGGVETASTSKINPHPTASATLDRDTPIGSEDETELPEARNNETQLLALPQNPYLKPKGLLAHDLFLGSLATEKSGPFITLTATQLFDLATALDDYAADVIALPRTKRAALPQRLPPWTRVAALILVTVGATVAAIKGLEQQNQLATTANKTAQEQPNVASAPTDIVPPSAGQEGVINPATQTPAIAQISPLPLPNTNPNALTPTAPNKLLPPPPPAGSIQTAPLFGQSTGQPTGQQLPSSNALPNNSAPTLTTRIPATTSGDANTATNTAPTLRVGQANLPPAISQPKASSRLSAPANNPFVITELPSPPANRRVAAQKTPARTVAPTAPSPLAALPQLSPSAIEPDNLPLPDTATNQSISSLPTELNLPAPNASTAARVRSELANKPDDDGYNRSLIEPSQTAKRQSPALNSTIQAQGSSSPVTSESAADTVSKATTIDTIPQVLQARNFLQKRWRTPEGLKQSLEYELLLNTDGTIERIVPLGQTAATYIDRTNIPLPGEKFVAPLEAGRTARIRAVFNKDGKVQTFLEN